MKARTGHWCGLHGDVDNQEPYPNDLEQAVAPLNAHWEGTWHDR